MTMSTESKESTDALTSLSFRDRHPEIQCLVRELQVLRAHNLQFNEGDRQDGLLLFAEAALVLLLLERFVRAVLDDTKDNDTIYTLLQRAVCRGLLRVPWEDQEDGIRRIKDVRNTILHGNYEQAARQSGQPSVAAYFKTQFAPEVERMTILVDHLFKQIDPMTGKPAPGGG
jgi:hypothetical protein